MPSPTSISVNDRAATPVAHTFNPAQLVGGVQYFLNSNGVKLGDKTITISQRKAGSKWKPRIVVTVPVVQDETINGITVPKVVRTAYADITLTFDDSSTTQERSDLVGFISDLLSASQTGVDSVLTDLEYWY